MAYGTSEAGYACPMCGGTGESRYAMPSADGGPPDCPSCQGTGKTALVHGAEGRSSATTVVGEKLDVVLGQDKHYQKPG